MSLREYAAKRKFAKTKEPPPPKGLDASKQKKRGTQSLFVVQKHDATHLHFDFRLAIDGVLKSWAVPKGIPLKAGEKHLAVEVEDHPLEYGDFEGTIPEGEYGGGTVMLWDRGTFEVLGGDPHRALEEGKLHLFLSGLKLQGEWTLVRIALAGRKPQWLFLKSGSEDAVIDRRIKERSVISDRTLTQIRDRKSGEVWEPRFVKPMLARPRLHLPEGKVWEYEVKYDGFRVIVCKSGSEVVFFSRNGKRIEFPALAKAVAHLCCDRGIFDGEIVALDPNGRPSFQLLQQRGRRDPPATQLYLFDLLEENGIDYTGKPLVKRRAALKRILQEGGGGGGEVLYSEELKGDPKVILAKVAEFGLEGVVAKRLDSVYESGLRTGAWVKVKCLQEAPFVIAGYTRSSAQSFGALLLGYYSGEEFLFAGRVGTGFSESTRRDLLRKFGMTTSDQCPFKTQNWQSGGAFGKRLKMGDCTWLKPKWVALIRYTEWPVKGRLRHPVFVGLANEIAANEVVNDHGGEGNG